MRLTEVVVDHSQSNIGYSRHHLNPGWKMYSFLTLLLLNMTYSVLANSVEPDQLAFEEANWSGSILFVIKYVNFYQKLGSSNLIGWKLEVGVAS